MKKLFLGILGAFVLLGVLILTNIIHLPDNSPTISIESYYVADKLNDHELPADKQYLVIVYDISNRTKEPIADDSIDNIVVINDHEYRPDLSLYDSIFTSLDNIDEYKRLTELTKIAGNTTYNTIVSFIIDKNDIDDFKKGKFEVHYKDAIDEVHKIIKSDFKKIDSLDKIIKDLEG